MDRSKKTGGGKQAFINFKEKKISREEYNCIRLLFFVDIGLSCM